MNILPEGCGTVLPGSARLFTRPVRSYCWINSVALSYIVAEEHITVSEFDATEWLTDVVKPKAVVVAD